MSSRTTGRFFHTVNGFLFVLLSLTMIGPIIHLASVSFSSPEFIRNRDVYLWPRGFNLEAYRTIFDQTYIWKSLGVSVYITVLGTFFALFLTATLAYSLTRPMMKGRKWVLKGIIVTFIFSIPLIPFYMIVKNLGMLNSLWSIMIPGALSAFNVIIMKTFFQNISAELFDSAEMDGCSEFGMFYFIAIPLSLPSIATIGLFHAVQQWNSYFYPLIFLRDKSLYPIQVVLKGLVIDQSALDLMSSSDMLAHTTPEQMKAGIIIFATLPILLVYPFIQKYFVKGAMLGSLKE
jgi:putative aldouronate transport system permease protein